jgi:hypothetical protein
MTTVNNTPKKEVKIFNPYDLMIKTLEDMKLTAPEYAIENIETALTEFKTKAADYLASKN